MLGVSVLAGVSATQPNARLRGEGISDAAVLLGKWCCGVLCHKLIGGVG